MFLNGTRILMRSGTPNSIMAQAKRQQMINDNEEDDGHEQDDGIFEPADHKIRHQAESLFSYLHL